MTILFLAPSVAQGRDGVADYTLRLADVLTGFGCRTAVIGWHDPHVTEVVRDKTMLRLPRHLSLRDKRAQAEAFAYECQPDWVSVQFVGYGYHQRALPWFLASAWQGLRRNRRLHWMFHEIWLGAKRESTLKERVLGFAQKIVVRQLLNRLKPEVIHTQAHAHRHVLARAGIPALRLPLFGNVPNIAGNAPQPKSHETGLRRIGAKKLVLGLFGTIHPECNFIDFWRHISAIVRKEKSVLVIEHAGRRGEIGNRLWQMWGKALPEISWKDRGEMGESQLSHWFASLDFGVAASPLALLDKSGSAAAMNEHGLPLLCPRDDVSFPGFAPEELMSADEIWHPGKDLTAFLRNPPRPSTCVRVEDIASQWLKDIEMSRA